MVEVKFADIAEGLEEGKVLEIFVKVGDTVEAGDDLFSVETDKVSAEIPAPEDGVIHKIYISAGQEIKVGDVVIEIDDEAEAGASSDAPPEEATAEAPPADADAGASVVGSAPVGNEVIASRSVAAETTKVAKTAQDILSTPLARKIAADLKIDLTLVNGTGPRGRILKSDIETYKANSATAPTTAVSVASAVVALPPFHFDGAVETKAMPAIRKAIARQMNIANTYIPSTSLVRKINVDELIALRNQLKPTAVKQEVRLTFMAFITRAVIRVLQEFPMFNSSYDSTTETLFIKKYYNIGFACDTPSGLMVPVIHEADQMNLFALANSIVDLATKARDRKLSPKAMQNSTFTITNFGSVGVEIGTPVINYPEVAILGLGTIVKEPIVVGDEIKIGSTMMLSLTLDHRVIDGADGGRFLMRLQELLEAPALLFI